MNAESESSVTADDFWCLYFQGYSRVAACTVRTELVKPLDNARIVAREVQQCHDDGVAVAAFPELCLSGYSIDDLVLNDTLLTNVTTALSWLIDQSVDWSCVVVVGAPLLNGHRLYNCAVVIHRGELLGVVPKSYLPNYREFYEKRHYAAGVNQPPSTITLGERTVPFGSDLLFEAADVPGLVVHVEVCEDLWVPVSPSSLAALAGASVLVNISGSPITVGKSDDRHLLTRAASSKNLAAYVYAAAGEGESTTDLAWDGQAMVFECGDLLAETERFVEGACRAVTDVDLHRIRQERLRQGSFDDNRVAVLGRAESFRRVPFRLSMVANDRGLRRKVSRFPFVPDDPAKLAQECYEAYNIQVAGLEQRLLAIGNPKVVIGVSGGLDSTHALLVAAHTMDRLGRPRTDILAFTMPGFATSDHTKSNAWTLAQSLGVTMAEIDITVAARQMLDDLDHPFSEGEPIYDVTFENVQAGLRTDYLFRIANHRGGIVLGTGDLSELALGWATYGVGDQMSHYTVNSGVPKTLIQHLIRWVIATNHFGDGTAEVLESILNTEISPELVPTDGSGDVQSTQAVIGPYELQDFTLFYTLRHGFSPARIAFLQWHAWHAVEAGSWPPGFGNAERHEYSLPDLKHWMQIFMKRFFGFSQFKRSALPNGPKVHAGGSLSPRGDWRAPSDASADIWVTDLERIPDI